MKKKKEALLHYKTIAQLCFTTRLVILNPNIQRTVLPTLHFDPAPTLYPLFLLLGHFYLWVTVAQRLFPSAGR